MNIILIVAVGVLIALALLISLFNLFGIGGIVVALIFIAVILAVIAYARTAYVLIDETTYGVVFNKLTNQFAYFIDEKGRFRGKTRLKTYHKPTYYHRLNPLTETLYGTISKGSYNAKGVNESLRTKEGIPVNITWTIEFKVDPAAIIEGIEHKVARGMSKNASGMITKKARHALRHLIESKSITDLYEHHSERGALSQLEDEFRQAVWERSKSVGVQPIGGNDSRIDLIAFPERVESALKSTYEQKLQSKTEAAALKYLHEAIHEFDEEDMERLTKMEQLRLFSKNNVSFMIDPTRLYSGKTSTAPPPSPDQPSKN